MVNYNVLLLRNPDDYSIRDLLSEIEMIANKDEKCIFYHFFNVQKINKDKDEYLRDYIKNLNVIKKERNISERKFNKWINELLEKGDLIKREMYCPSKLPPHQLELKTLYFPKSKEEKLKGILCRSQ